MLAYKVRCKSDPIPGTLSCSFTVSQKRPSVLKKSAPNRSAVQNKAETSSKCHKTGFSGPETAVRKGHKGVFQQAGPFVRHSPPLQNAYAFLHLYPLPQDVVVELIIAMSPEVRFTLRASGFYLSSWISVSENFPSRLLVNKAANKGNPAP